MKDVLSFFSWVILAVVFFVIFITKIDTNTQSVVSDLGNLVNGDKLTFAQDRPIHFEAQSDDPFTFVAGEQVINGEPFAAGYTASVDLTTSSLWIVNGNADVKIAAADGIPFEYSYSPGSGHNTRTFFAHLVWWIIACFIFWAFIYLIWTED